MFTYVLRRENPFNQIIYTSTLSSMAFRPLAEQCDSVQKTFLISRYILQKMIPEAMEKCKFLSKMLWNILLFLPGGDVWCPAHKNSNTAVENITTITSWQNNRSRIPFYNLLNSQMSPWKHTDPESIICILLQVNKVESVTFMKKPMWCNILLFAKSCKLNSSVRN